MAAVTVASTSRGFHEASTIAYWSARCAFDTGTALYVVTQDTGATPKVRVYKANSRTAPTSFSEQDSANNKAITNVAFPYSAWYDGTRYIHVVVFTATNTITHYRFDTSTDLWTTAFGSVTTAASNERPIRVAVRSDNDVLVFCTSSADDADIGWSRYEGSSWTFSATAINSAASAEASTIVDAVMDSTDRAAITFYDANSDDHFFKTVNSANTVTGQIDIDTTSAAIESAHPAGGTFALYVDGTTDKIVSAYIDEDNSIRESTLTLETDAIEGSVATPVAVEATATNVGARTPLSTARWSTTDYCLWWDDATSGTIFYATKVSGTWGSRTAFKTSHGRPIQLLPVSGVGLLAVYQSDATTIAVDWIVAPSGGTSATMTVTTATATAQAEATTLDAAAKLTGASATATAQAEGVTFDAASKLTATTAAAVAQAESITLDAAAALTTATATATSQAEAVAFDANVAAILIAEIATATAQAGAVILLVEGAGPNLKVWDTFTETTDTALSSHTGEIGATWVGVTGGAGEFIISDANKARYNGGSGFYMAASGVLATTDQDISVDINVKSVIGSYIGIMGRASASSVNGYLVHYNDIEAPPRVTLTKVVSGSVNYLDNYLMTIADGTTGTLRLEIRTATKKVFWDDVEIISSNDDAITTGDRAGLFGYQPGSNTTGIHIDNFNAWDFTTAIPATMTVTPATGTAQAEGVTFDAGIAMTVTTATATAAAGTLALTGQGLLAVTVASATAQAESITLDAAAALTTTTATATAQGEGVTLDASSALTVATATSTAQGEATALSGQARIAVSAATATAQAEAVGLAGQALLTITPATATAQAETVVLDADVAAILTAGTATSTAQAETASMVGQARLAIDAAVSTSQAGAIAFNAASLFTASIATATTQAEDVTFDAAGRMVLMTAEANAQVEDVMFSAGGVAVLSASTATATATAEDVTIDAAGRLVLDAATATADAGTVTFAGAAALTTAAATATATAEAVTFDAASQFAIGTASATSEAGSITVGGAATLAATAAIATAQAGAVILSAAGAAVMSLSPATATSAAGTVTLDASSVFSVGAALATAEAGPVLLLELPTVYYPWPGAVTVSAVPDAPAFSMAAIPDPSATVTTINDGPAVSRTTVPYPTATIGTVPGSPAVAFMEAPTPVATITSVPAPGATFFVVPDLPNTSGIVPGPLATFTAIPELVATFTAVPLPDGSMTSIPWPTASAVAIPDAPAMVVVAYATPEV